MRGVYPKVTHFFADFLGSSPHARGLLGALDQQAQGPRIIPACAGFTASPACPPAWTSDHPRMRGVYGKKNVFTFEAEGSSPHARGLHLAILGIPTVLESTTPRFPSLLT